MPPMGSKSPSLKSLFPSTSDTAPHIVIDAKAGTGKTTTLVEGLKVAVYGQKSIITPSEEQEAIWKSLEKSRGCGTACFVAFNRSIRDELANRVPAGCAAMTLHGLGFRSVNSYKRTVMVEERTDRLIEKATGKPINQLWRQNKTVVQASKELVSLCKQNMVWGPNVDWSQELPRLASFYDVDIETNSSTTQILDIVPKVIKLAAVLDGTMDYDDMVWLTVVNKLSVIPYDLLLVDEAQDLNCMQQQLAKMCGKRLVFCGDPHQAIYGFAGADSEGMQNIIEDLADTKRGVVVLPLTVTRRCGKKIVELAQKLVPGYTAHESNPEGAVHYDKTMGNYRDVVKPGDLVLCRTTAPLISECFKMLKEGRIAKVQGQKVGSNLASLVKRLMKSNYSATSPSSKDGAEEIIEFKDRVKDWKIAEVEKEEKNKTPSEQKLITICDKAECLLAFAEGSVSIYDLLNKIDMLFTDRGSNGVLLSTIHKAKGLEANSVFLIFPRGVTIPHVMAKSKWQVEQEWNLLYVAQTRAIENLYMVKS